MSERINDVFESTVVSMVRLWEDKEVLSKLNGSNLLTEFKESHIGCVKHHQQSESRKEDMNWRSKFQPGRALPHLHTHSQLLEAPTKHSLPSGNGKSS